jgi:predicted ATPase/Tfp pilus assembly protein PilF
VPLPESPRTPRHLHVVRRRPPGFPSPLTGFVGREREIAEVGALLERTRLLTLTGAGGSGKTRLSIEAAIAALDAFPDGAAWVELAPLGDPALVPQAVASALEVRQQPGRQIVDALAATLISRRFLLVLDNCEHLLESCAALASSLLHACPELRILATSREALRIAGEVTWRVPPLSLPEPSAGLEALERSEAVRLFDERARAIHPSFRLDEDNAGDVARICQRLEGIPLAIELAAARVRVLSPAQIAERLDHSFALLTGGTRDAAPRQQTLRAAIDWSYDLLTDPERTLFARLSVFAGGFTLDAAEAVCGGDRIPPGELLDLLTHLVDKSLVVVEERRGEARCRMLETIREYAADRLAGSGEAEALGLRHAAHYLGIAEEAEPELQGARQAAMMDRLEEEHDNLRAALRWLVARREGTLAARLGGAIWRFWQTRGYLGEGRQWLREVLEVSSATGGDAGSEELRGARGKALQGAGVLAWGQGEYDRAAELFEEALAIFEALANDDGVAALRNNLGVIALHRGDYPRATELFEASLALRRQQRHATGIGTTLNNLGATAGKQGDLARARHYYEESLALQREHGNVQGAAISLSNLGATAYSQDDFAQAHRFFSEGLELRQLLGDRTGVADSLAKLGRVALRQGEMERARAHYAASLEQLRELGDRERIASGMMGIAALALAREQVARAVRLLGAADGIRTEIGAPLTAEERADQERSAAAARERMGEQALATLWAEGRTLPLQQALELAEEELAEPLPAEGGGAPGGGGGGGGAGAGKRLLCRIPHRPPRGGHRRRRP